MSRKRLIAPAFFTNADLYDAEASSGLPIRVAFAGLWTVTDRRGIFRWSRNLKPDILPYDPCDILACLDALERAGFIRSYEVAGRKYGHIPSFTEHQTFHLRERPSTDPLPPWMDGAQGQHGARNAEGKTESTDPARGEHRAGPEKAMPGPSVTVTVTGTGTGTAEEARPATPAPSMLERFVLVEHGNAYLAYRRAHRYPDALDATLNALHEGMTGSGAVAWDRIGAALVQMQAAGHDFNARVLAGFCRKLAETPATTGSGSARQDRNLAAIEEGLRRYAPLTGAADGES